jgi:hypothetical protein
VKDRLAREREKFAGFDELKTKAAKLDELEAANRTELEKLQTAATAEKARADAAESKMKEALRRSAVVAAAQRAGAVDPDAVYALLNKDEVTIGDDGQVTGVEEAVKALLVAKEYLVGKTPKPPAGSANAGPQGSPGATQWTREDLRGKSSAEIEAARKAGLLNNVMSGAT